MTKTRAIPATDRSLSRHSIAFTYGLKKEIGIIK